MDTILRVIQPLRDFQSEILRIGELTNFRSLDSTVGFVYN